MLKLMLTANQFVLINSPAGSGKSALLHILADQLSITYRTIGCYRMSMDSSTVYDWMKEAGVDLRTRSCSFNHAIIVLDDAHLLLMETDFWHELLIDGPKWLPPKVKIIISTRHLNSSSSSAMQTLRKLPSLTISDMRLTKQEVQDLLFCPSMGLPHRLRFTSILNAIDIDCNGNISAIRLFIESLFSAFFPLSVLSESLVMRYFMSNDLKDFAQRCFGGEKWPFDNEELKALLAQCLFKGFILDESTLSHAQLNFLNTLQERGIIAHNVDGDIKFTSLLAKRCCFKALYYRISCYPYWTPRSLKELLTKTFGSISTSALRRAMLSDDEATFWHLFIQGLSENRNFSSSICPDVFDIFGAADALCENEIGLYIGGTLCWLLILRFNVSHHSAHYRSNMAAMRRLQALQIRDYAFVDIFTKPRDQKPKLVYGTHRIGIYLREDFTSCELFCSEEPDAVTVSLPD
jgi:energy-coupling factor transporter ATP-binding protein EcfA2